MIRTALSPTSAPAGSQILIKYWHRDSPAEECLVVEWSPNQKYVKLKYATQPEGAPGLWVEDPERYYVADVLTKARDPGATSSADARVFVGRLDEDITHGPVLGPVEDEDDQDVSTFEQDLADAINKHSK